MSTKKKDNIQIYVKQIEAISKVANLITSGMYLEELLRLVVQVTAEIMNSKVSSLMLFDPNKNALVISATKILSFYFEKADKPMVKLRHEVCLCLFFLKSKRGKRIRLSRRQSSQK